MSLPIVAVVGRANVGKSTFVNRIAQMHDAIVHEQRGVTRDRSYHKADWCGREFMLIDTGGVEFGDDDAFQSSIRTQAIMAMEEADAIVFICDGRTGITPEDEAVAKLLKRSSKPIFLVVNKMDTPGREDELWEFYNLGMGDPWAVSATHGHGTGDLLDAIMDVLPEDDGEVQEDDDAINVAIIGRPNAGKSSLTNQLVGKERSIVSDVAGTTRDAIDTVVEHDGKKYRIVDTAGIRRKSQIDESVEYYGFVRAMRAIDRADVALLVVDSSIGLTDQDQRVAALAHERGCGLVILLNKWDLLTTPEERADLEDRVEDRMIFVSYAPVLRISVLTGRSIHRIWDAIDLCYLNASTIIPTNKLNNLLSEIREFGHTVVRGNQRLKMNYVTQTGSNPPVFTFFCNFPELAEDPSFQRYIENRLRDRFPLEGTPIRLKFKKKG